MNQRLKIEDIPSVFAEHNDDAFDPTRPMPLIDYRCHAQDEPVTTMTAELLDIIPTMSDKSVSVLLDIAVQFKRNERAG